MYCFNLKKITLAAILALTVTVPVWFYTQSNKDNSKHSIADDSHNQVSSKLDLTAKTKAYTTAAVEHIRELAKQDELQNIVKNYKLHRSNIFFDESIFFQNLSLTSNQRSKLFNELENESLLDSIVFSKDDNDENVPPLLEQRMAIIDFLESYALHHNKSDENRIWIRDALAKHLETSIANNLSMQAKRILVAERIDLLQTLTRLDPQKALDTLSAMPRVIQEKILIGYYHGLEASHLDKDEYQDWIHRVQLILDR